MNTKAASCKAANPCQIDTYGFSRISGFICLTITKGIRMPMNRRISLAACVAITLLLWAGAKQTYAAEDIVDPCEKTDNFFLFPGESNGALLVAKDGMVELSKPNGGDAFTRWSTKAMEKIELATCPRWLSIRFDKFTKDGTAAKVYVLFFKGNKRMGKTEAGEISGGPGVLSADIKALAEKNAPEATGFWLFLRHGNDPKGIIKIDEIRLSDEKPEVPAHVQKAIDKNTPLPPKPIEQIVVKVESHEPVPVVTPGHEEAAVLVVSNPTEASVALKLEARIENYHRESKSIEETVTIPASGRSQTTPLLPLFENATHGAYMIDYKLTDTATGGTTEGITSFAYMDPAGPRPFRPGGFLFSVNGGTRDIKNTEDSEKAARMMGLTGINVSRISLVWEALQYKGPKHWSPDKLEAFGRTLDILRKNGIEAQIMLGYNVPWNVPEELKNTNERRAWQFCPPNRANPDAWIAYVNTMLENFGDRIRWWEVWNEPDLYDFWRGSSDEYIDLLKITYPVIKQNNPEHQVLTGGFALLRGHPGHKEENFQEKVAVKARPYYDIHAHHCHGHTDNFYVEIDERLAPIQKKIHPPAPLWFNETATATAADGYREQAADLTRKLLYAWGHGAIGYNWYQMRGGTLDPDARRRWGMVSNDLEPKPVYVAYNTLVKLLGDKEFVTELDRGDDRYGFVFRKRTEGGEYAIGLWDEYRNLSQQPVAFKIGDDAEAIHVDLMGNRSPLTVKDGVVVIESGLYTRFLLIRNATQAPAMLRPLIVMAGPLPSVTPGRTYTLPVTVTNPLEGESSLILRWEDVPGAEATSTATIAIPAGGTSEHTFRFDIPNDFSLPYGDLHTMKLHYSLTAADWSGQLSVPVDPTVRVRLGAMDSRTPDVILEKYRYVNNRHENVPQRAHLTWQGKEDVSARIWLQRDGDFLRIRADVMDDYHNANLDNMGDADCVSLIITPTDIDQRHVIYFARSNDGRDVVNPVRAPDGTEKPEGITLNTTPIEGGLRYEIGLPRETIGLSDSALASGIRMNVVVVDRDKEAREGWIQIAPSKNWWAQNWDPAMFTQFVFDLPTDSQ